jgi:thiamine-monophosphate kinase
MMAADTKARAPARPGEFELIARYFAPLSGEGSFGLADDAALVVVTPGKSLAMTQDAIAAGVHFFPDDPPRTIAMKALRVNLSDLAAKGAVPRAFSLALGLHPDWTEAWIAAFAEGLAEDCRKHDLLLSGGDTFRVAGGPVISITAWGELDAADYASRLSARPGDRLFVTGTIGDGALGLKVRLGEEPYCRLAGAGDLLARYLVPEPPVEFAEIIARFAAASMDISDGFAGDLEKMARASGVDLEIDGTAIPFSSAVMEALSIPGAMHAAISGGDDYQIAFTVPQWDCEEFLRAAVASGTRVACVGTAVEGAGNVRISGKAGEGLSHGRTSYAHF